MTDRLIALIVDESKWLTVSMALGLVLVALLLHRHGRRGSLSRHHVSAAMSFFFGVTLGTMAFGHLLAVTTKLASGTLEGSLTLLYAIGVLLAVPSGWLIHHARSLAASAAGNGSRTVLLNAWLAATLLALGLHNLPLAIPALLNIGYHLHTRRRVGWALVGVAVVFHAGLFIGSVMFLASGQSFEQFTGME